MHLLLLPALLVVCAQNVHGLSTNERYGITQAEVAVQESWPSNELVFTWDPEYFKQFFKPGANIMIQATAYISETKEELFTASGIGILHGAKGGTAKISISNANKEEITKYSHYYVLKPVGTSNIYLSSSVIKSTYA